MATKSYTTRSPFSVTSELPTEQLESQAEEIMNDSMASAEDKFFARKTLMLIQRDGNVQNLLDDHKPVSAKAYILARAREYHFTLINEAHYSGQCNVQTFNSLTATLRGSHQGTSFRLCEQVVFKPPTKP